MVFKIAGDVFVQVYTVTSHHVMSVFRINKEVEGGLNKFIGVVINKHEQTFEVIVLGLNNCRGLKESVPFVIPVAVTLI